MHSNAGEIIYWKSLYIENKHKNKIFTSIQYRQGGGESSKN